MPLPLDRVVDINVNPTVAPGARRDFGRGAFIWAPPTSTAEATIRRDHAVRFYDGFDALSADYGVDDAPYQAGLVWFAQVPRPRPLMVAGMFAGGSNGFVYGRSSTATRSQIQAIASLQFLGQDITVDLSTATTTSAIGTAIAAGINANASITGASVDVTGTAPGATGAGDIRISITIPEAEAGDQTLSFERPFVRGSSAELLGLDVTGEANVAPVANETVAQALARINTRESNWYLFAMDAEIEETADNVVDAAIYAGSATKAYFPTITGAASLGSGASVDKTLNLGNYTNCVGTWSQQRDYKGLGIAARQSAVDFVSGSVINLNNRLIRGVTADDLTSQQATQLLASNTNGYLLYVGGRSAYQPGRNYNGAWADEQFFIDWLVDRIQNEVMDRLQQEPRVPQTALGWARVASVIRASCELGLSNGALAGGAVDEDTAGDIRRRTGQSDFDGVLPRGSRVYVRPPTSSDIANRRLTVDVWLRFSGAVNSVTVNLNF